MSSACSSAASTHSDGPCRPQTELDALAAALAMRRGFADTALRLVNALARFWFLRGRFTEARRPPDLALSAGGTPERGSTAHIWRVGMSLLLLDMPETATAGPCWSCAPSSRTRSDRPAHGGSSRWAGPGSETSR